jgi:putative ABC transport system permease protein
MAEQGIEGVSVPLAQLVTYLLIGAVTGVFAATLPARRAAKLDILRAVTVE